MNLYNKIRKELEEKHYDDTITKIVLIYIRLCEKIQYDDRWRYAEKTHNNEILDELFNQEINIYDTETLKTVCHGFARAYCQLANELLSFDQNYDISLTKGSISHEFIETYLTDGTIIEIDPFSNPTAISDLLNVKKGLSPAGISISNSPEYNDEYRKEKALHLINYKNNNLYIKYLQLLKKELLKEKRCTPEKINELFHFFKDTSNFTGLGIKEVQELFYLTITEITNCVPSELHVYKKESYNPITQKVNYLYQIPIDSENDEYFTLEEKAGNITWEQVKKPIKEYSNRKNHL